MVSTPKDLLLPYQRKWVDDKSRFKMGIWSRQTGKDFSTAAEIVEDCLTKPKTTWLIGAPSERQAVESLGKCKEWSEAYSFAIADAFELRESDHPQALLKSSEILFQNGSRVIAVPGKPETVRGFSANIDLTEFAFFEKEQETWRAMLPSIVNPLRGGPKKVRLITTPNGKGGKTWDIWEKNYVNPDPNRKQKWSCHFVPIDVAKSQGLDVDIEELVEAMDDPEGAAQELFCEFLDGSNVLLPYDIIQLAESFEATEVWDFGAPSSAPIFLGVDFGRTNDPTVCWTLQRIGDILWTREVLVLHKVSSPDQEQILRDRIRAANRVCFDYTGPGIGLGDYLVKTHGEWKPDGHSFGKIELCTFTVGFKRELFPNLRRKFEAPTKLRIPVSITIREDLHQMQQVITNGEYNYWSPRTKKGHSDRCTALALANRAASGPMSDFGFDPLRGGDRASSGARVNRRAIGV